MEIKGQDEGCVAGGCVVASANKRRKVADGRELGILKEVEMAASRRELAGVRQERWLGAWRFGPARPWRRCRRRWARW